MSAEAAATLTRTAIVVIDNNAVTLASCRQILEREGYEVEVYDNGVEGLAGVARARAAVAVVDLNMPVLGGLEVIARLRAAHPEVAILAITGYPTVESAVVTMKRGADDYLAKPFTPLELRRAVAGVLRTRHTAADSPRPRRAVEEST